ncbi:nucleoside/nucleotide kinase family protein [Nocardioides sp. cx-173]|uniref:nucleoside/nucleotide kinase family protein n=1 Tax=Nocardioides sp. cx-173 TaxID=2898796 RepID=UPI001E3A96F3|nr:nucleoside/nucleotide kinase family protein [Nocardioides sp. cx-173]MCD4527094.1 nucleoside/nucleotide kinase family protein [Nocardioides sp. cx-173]UGB42458.1 nucleoside/nucleotide kinase family protein [Nocardioides sp. cx-173]
MLRLSPDAHELPGLLPAAGRMLGLTGAPGAGKSTLAALLAARHGATVVPMDGFHLADVELERRGLRQAKGAAETFDVLGYAALLRRVRDREDLVLAPMFERDLEQPVAGALPVRGEAELVVTEGNYLLLPQQPWPRVRAQLDTVWHVVTDEDLRLERLLARHMRFGKTPAEARAWVERVDGPNGVLIEAVAERADLVLDLTDLATWEAS